MQIHLGHHFYGAGNVGDDFMLGGFLRAMVKVAPSATYTACVPFPLAPLRQRFPQVEWQPYGDAERDHSIQNADAWVGLGGSPFQSAQSRWFVDHLVGDAARCAKFHCPMFFLGVGVQQADELVVSDIRAVCQQALGIWTRDAGSANRLKAARLATRIRAAADFSHVLFRAAQPPRPRPGRVGVVANFDFGNWPGIMECLTALERLTPSDHVWLAQESRELPGAERAFFKILPAASQAKWRLELADIAGASLADVIARWSTPEWLVTSRYHAAIASAWAGTKVVVIGTNEKLRGVADDLNAPLVSPDSDVGTWTAALNAARPATGLAALAERAEQACAEFVTALDSR